MILIQSYRIGGSVDFNDAKIISGTIKSYYDCIFRYSFENNCTFDCF